ARVTGERHVAPVRADRGRSRAAHRVHRVLNGSGDALERPGGDVAPVHVGLEVAVATGERVGARLERHVLAVGADHRVAGVAVAGTAGALVRAGEHVATEDRVVRHAAGQVGRVAGE